MNDDSELNFDAANLENATQGATRAFNFLKDGIAPGLAVAALLLVVLVSLHWAKKNDHAFSIPEPLKIKNWPAGLRLSLVPLLVSFALTHAFAAASVYYNTTVSNPNTDSYFQNIGVGRLFSLSHAHLFAHAAMYFMVATLVQFTNRGRLFTLCAPIIALWAGVFDVVSWWGLKKVSPNFEILSAL